MCEKDSEYVFITISITAMLARVADVSVADDANAGPRVTKDQIVKWMDTRSRLFADRLANEESTPLLSVTVGVLIQDVIFRFFSSCAAGASNGVAELRSKPLSGSGSSDSNVTVSVMLSSELPRDDY